MSFFLSVLFFTSLALSALQQYTITPSQIVYYTKCAVVLIFCMSLCGFRCPGIGGGHYIPHSGCQATIVHSIYCYEAIRIPYEEFVCLDRSKMDESIVRDAHRTLSNNCWSARRWRLPIYKPTNQPSFCAGHISLHFHFQMEYIQYSFVFISFFSFLRTGLPLSGMCVYVLVIYYSLYQICCGNGNKKKSVFYNVLT